MERGTPLPRYFPLPQFILDVDISSTSEIAAVSDGAFGNRNNIGCVYAFWV